MSYPGIESISSFDEAIDEAPYVLPIHELRNVLASISEPCRRFWLDDPIVTLRARDAPISWAMLYCACPTAGQMTDRLSFGLPIFSNTLKPRREEEAMICIGADTLWPAQEGLYIEDGQVLFDCMEDWYLVWPALQRQLEEYQSRIFMSLQSGLPTAGTVLWPQECSADKNGGNK
jgi:hypothetical protein